MYNDHIFVDKGHCTDCWAKWKEMSPRLGDFPKSKMVNDMRDMENEPIDGYLREIVDKHFNENKASAHVDKYGKIFKNNNQIGRIWSDKVVINNVDIPAADPDFFKKLDDAIVS